MQIACLFKMFINFAALISHSKVYGDRRKRYEKKIDELIYSN